MITIPGASHQFSAGMCISCQIVVRWTEILCLQPGVHKTHIECVADDDDRQEWNGKESHLHGWREMMNFV
jgi:hypothetical protein